MGDSGRKASPLSFAVLIMSSDTRGKEDNDKVEIEQMRQMLSYSGCRESVAEEILRSWEEGDRKDALWLMKKDRCRLMEEMHEKSRMLDRLDLLIRNVEKELKDPKRTKQGAATEEK
jgi:hypothetical protein